MNLEKFIAIVKEDFPSTAVDLSKHLKSLNGVMNQAMNSANEKMNNAFLARDFQSREKYNQVILELYQYEKKLNKLMCSLETHEPAIQTDIHYDEMGEEFSLHILTPKSCGTCLFAKDCSEANTHKLKDECGLNDKKSAIMAGGNFVVDCSKTPYQIFKDGYMVGQARERGREAIEANSEKGFGHPKYKGKYVHVSIDVVHGGGREISIFTKTRARIIGVTQNQDL